MVYLSKKAIKGQTYYYAVKSLRLPNGKGITLQKLLGKKHVQAKNLEAAHAAFFRQKEKEALTSFALKSYKAGSVFSEEEIEKAECLKVDYQALLKSLSRADHKDLFDRFTANFTYESNAIEGSSLTLKDVAIVMFENRVPKGKDLREVFETRNSRKVVDRILKKKFDVTEKDIIRMHKMLMENIDDRLGYKQWPNKILGSTVELTPPEKVKREMAALIKWFEARSKDMHPLQLAALVHGKFEKIHPFADGNGRVGRFIAITLLVNQGYPPLIIHKTQRDAYIKCLDDFHRGYATNLERFFLEKYKKTFENFFAGYLKYIKPAQAARRE